MDDIIIIGAGNIGRGVAGLLFSQSGYRLHFYDLNQEMLHDLKEQGYYHVQVTDGKEIDEHYRISDFQILDSSLHELSQMMSQINTIACCVYEKAFPSIAEAVVSALRKRRSENNQKVWNILLCVNSLDAPQKLTALIEAKLQEEEKEIFHKQVGICQVMVLAAGLPSIGKEPFFVTISANPSLEIDGVEYKGEKHFQAPITFVNNARALLYRKVYVGI